MNYRKWGQAELDFIKNNADSISDDELALQLSRITSSTITTPMVRRQRRKLSLKKSRGRPRKTNTVSANSSTNS